MSAEINPEETNPEETNSRRSEEKERFLYPRAPYRGPFTPENLVFNANLQEFAQRVAFICALETGGKISAPEAYEQIRGLWESLSRSEENLFSNPSEGPPE